MPFLGNVPSSFNVDTNNINNGAVTSPKLSSNLNVDLDSGSAATPSLTFDANTGLYSPGEDQVAISTGGSGRLFVDASGRILVGNSATTGVAGFNGFLQLQGTNFDTATVALTNVAANNTGSYLLLGKARGGTLGGYTSVNNGDNLGQIRFMGADGTGYVEAAYIGVTCNGVPGTNNMPGRLFFSTNSGTSSVTERMCITPSGLVGVGTSSPSQILDVQASKVVAIFTSTSGTNGSYQIFNNTGGNLYFGLDNSAGSEFASAYAGVMWHGGARPLLFATSNIERMRIDSSGRVGIGTTSPVNKLDVNGSISASGNFSNTGNTPSVHIGLSSGTPAICSGNNVASTYLPLVFLRETTTGSAESMRLDASGRLLVGTSSSPGSGDGQYSRLVIQGYVGANTSQGIMSLQRGVTASSITTGQGIGVISFNDSSGGTFSSIYCEADGNGGAGDYPGRLVFSTTADGAAGPTERMRINSDGVILTATTTSSGSANGVIIRTGPGTTSDASCMEVVTSAGDGRFFIGFRNNATSGRASGAIVGSISTNGSTTSFNNSSDYRLKENITEVTDGIARLQKLKPSRFNFIIDPNTTVDGFIAHEVQEVVPEAVTGEKDAINSEGNPIYQGIDQSKLVPLLTAALQEAVAKIETLEATNVDLLARVTALESA